MIVHPKVATGRVAIYARYSSDRQSEASIEDQVRRARDVIARAGGDPDKALVFPDFAISGASLARPGLEQLLGAVEQDRVDVILTEDVSRISRDLGDASQIFKRLQFAGVPLISISDGIDTSAKHAKLNYAVKSLLADLYLDDLRDKTLRGLEGRALAGLATGQVPYGYRTAPRQDRNGRPIGSEIVIDELTAAVVRRVFAMYRDGCALHFISRTLTREKVPSARTRTRHTTFGWGPPGISGMLRQEKYIGIWRFKETQWVKEPGTNRRVPRKRPPEEVITTERPDLRIIGAELWSEVQERLASRQRGAPRATERVLSARRSKYLLSGIVVCHECGKPLTIDGSSTTYYRCQTHKAKGSCGNDLRIREALLRAECLEAIRMELQTPANLAYVRQQIVDRLRDQPAQNTNELDERRQRLTAGKDRLKQLVDFVASGHRSNAVGDEIRLLETQNAVDIAAIERLERLAREATRPLAILPNPEEITARAFDVHRLLAGDLDRARLHLTRWLKDGQIRVRPTPAGFELQGTCYPLLIFRRPENKKPKSGELLGESENVLLGSGGRI